MKLIDVITESYSDNDRHIIELASQVKTDYPYDYLIKLITLGLKGEPLKLQILNNVDRIYNDMNGSVIDVIQGVDLNTAKKIIKLNKLAVAAGVAIPNLDYINIMRGKFEDAIIEYNVKQLYLYLRFIIAYSMLTALV
jgi:hypothetical protein